MRKYLLHVLIISVVFILAPTAQVASYAGELEDAKEDVRNNPDDAWAHNNLGVAYYNLEMYEEAIKSYKQAIEINPDYAVVHGGLGDAYYKSGKHEEAIESFRQVISIDPVIAVAHYNLGHKDISTTQRYAHHCPDSLRDGVEILETDYNLTTVEKNVGY